ncbi:MAG: hypothetical protein Ta2G_18670 [Termitinemataceae bacterium]|nr:MAG: hypothetical protein Ta2G_18670 [Termitinemataceae bacterium]
MIKTTKKLNKLFFLGLLGIVLTLVMLLSGCKLSSCANNGNCSVTYGGIGQNTSCGASKCAVPVGTSTGTYGTTVKCDC